MFFNPVFVQCRSILGLSEAITGTTLGTNILGRVVGILMGWMYKAIMQSSEKQTTLGKMAVGIKVNPVLPYGAFLTG